MQVATHSSGIQSEADRLRARAIWLYHVEGLTQNDIATQLGISRVMVVRLLADARRRNEVRITIAAPLTETLLIERDVETRTAGQPGAKFLTQKDARGVVLDPFTDDDGAADIYVVEDTVDGIAGRGISQFLFAAAEPMHGVERRVFGGSDKFKFDGAFGV